MTTALEYGSVNFLATQRAALPRMKARWLRACGFAALWQNCNKGGTDESGRLQSLNSLSADTQALSSLY